jgi:hypothetical protein
MPALNQHSPAMSERTPPLAPGYRPGERMLDGKPYVFNADLLKRHLQQERIETAPADLGQLTSTQLLLIDYACTALWRDVECAELHRRVIAERSRRGLNTAFKTEAA